MEFHTTEELFGALSIPEIRRVVLQSASEAESRGETLKVLVGDRYGDLIGTADEAAEMFRGVQRLETRIKDLRRSTLGIFTASKPGIAATVPAAAPQEAITEALGEWGRGAHFSSTVPIWLPSSSEFISCFLDRGWAWRAACTLVTAEALSGSRLWLSPLLQGCRGSVIWGAKAILSKSLTKCTESSHTPLQTASSFAALLLLRARHQGGGGGDWETTQRTSRRPFSQLPC